MSSPKSLSVTLGVITIIKLDQNLKSDFFIVLVLLIYFNFYLLYQMSLVEDSPDIKTRFMKLVSWFNTVQII